MMPDRIQQQIGDLMGGGTFIASISLYSMEWFNLINVNDILTTISSKQYEIKLQEQQKDMNIDDYLKLL